MHTAHLHVHDERMLDHHRVIHAAGKKMEMHHIVTATENKVNVGQCSPTLLLRATHSNSSTVAKLPMPLTNHYCCAIYTLGACISMKICILLT